MKPRHCWDVTFGAVGGSIPVIEAIEVYYGLYPSIGDHGRITHLVAELDGLDGLWHGLYHVDGSIHLKCVSDSEDMYVTAIE